MKKATYYYPDEVLTEAQKNNMNQDALASYSDKVYLYISKLKPGGTLDVNKLAKQQTMALFLAVVKMYIEEMGDVSFNSSYSQINKSIAA